MKYWEVTLEIIEHCEAKNKAHVKRIMAGNGFTDKEIKKIVEKKRTTVFTK